MAMACSAIGGELVRCMLVSTRPRSARPGTATQFSTPTDIAWYQRSDGASAKLAALQPPITTSARASWRRRCAASSEAASMRALGASSRSVASRSALARNTTTWRGDCQRGCSRDGVSAWRRSSWAMSSRTRGSGWLAWAGASRASAKKPVNAARQDRENKTGADMAFPWAAALRGPDQPTPEGGGARQGGVVLKTVPQGVARHEDPDRHRRQQGRRPGR